MEQWDKHLIQHRYALEGTNVVPIRNLVHLVANSMPIIIKKTLIGEVEVSTVFVGLNLQPRNPIPQVFETMVFGHPSYKTTRYGSFDDAVKGHDKIVQEVLNETPNRN